MIPCFLAEFVFQMCQKQIWSGKQQQLAYIAMPSITRKQGFLVEGVQAHMHNTSSRLPSKTCVPKGRVLSIVKA